MKGMFPLVALGAGAAFIALAFKSKSSKGGELAPQPASSDLRIPSPYLWRLIDGMVKGRPDIVVNVAELIDRDVGPTMSSALAKGVAQRTTLNQLPEQVFEPGTNRSWTLAVDELLKKVNHIGVLELWLSEIRKFGMPRSVSTLEAKIRNLRGAK